MTIGEIKRRFNKKYGSKYILEEVSYMPWGAYIYARRIGDSDGVRIVFTIEF